MAVRARGSVAGSHRAPLTAPCPLQEACFSQIRDGLRTYHDSLAAVLELLPGHAGLVETLQLDAANLSSNIQQQVRGGRGLSGAEVGLPGVCVPREMGRVRGALRPRPRAGSVGTTRGLLRPWGISGAGANPSPLPGCRWRTWAWPR